jgi:UDP-glucose 4-epimerase
MKALVTGGCGFIGSHIVEALIARGDQVVVLDSETADNDVFYKFDGASYVKENILNMDAVSTAMKGVEIVFHLAAESRIGPAVENPRKATEVNVVGTCNVLQAARDANVKAFVYSSTSAAYGLRNRAPMHEEMLTDNLNAYSTSKVAGEDLTVMFAKLYKVPAIALRYFNVFGERMPSRGQYAPVLGIFLRQAAANQPLSVVGDGLQRRDFIHVRDIVQANLKAAQSAQQFAGNIYNVGTGKNASVMELASLFNRAVQHLPARAGEARETLANIEKITRDLKFSPTIDVIEWMKQEISTRSL